MTREREKMIEHAAELAAMRTRRDAISIERDILTRRGGAEARVWAIENELDNMNDRLDEIGIGDLPGDRGLHWAEGKISCVDDCDDHILVAVRLADGSRITASTVIECEAGDGTFEALDELVGKPARVCVGRLADGDTDHPAGLDRSLPILAAVVVGDTSFPHTSHLAGMKLHG
jgi:hypothetical protein